MINCVFIPAKSSIEPSTLKLVGDHKIHGYIVPDGFVSDGGSIPKPFTLLADRYGQALECYILHDYLLSISNNSKKKYRHADDTLYQHCLDIGVNKYRAKLIHWGALAGSINRVRKDKGILSWGGNNGQ